MKPLAPLRCGLIGYGAWGAHHARAIQATDGLELVAVCARSEESRQRATADHPGVRVYADYRRLLEQETLDAADVVLPSDLHFEAAQCVLASGRHLLLEKPMALRTADCDALNSLARSRGLVIAVGHELRMSSLWGKVKELVDDGAIGDPLYALIELWRNPYRRGSDGWRYDIRRVGNWILEEPIHFFDLARWYFERVGEPVSVCAAANGRQPDHPELHDNFSAILKFPAGGYAVVSQTLAGWEHHQVVKLTGTRGALTARWSGAQDRTFHPAFSLHVQQDQQVVEVPIERSSGEVYELVDQMQRLAGAFRDGSRPPCSGVDGRWSVAMCLAAQESLETGMPVKLCPAPPEDAA